jgi:lactoylglutathione lyase
VVAAVVYVEDVAASLAFYEGVLGVEREHLDHDGSYGELTSGIGFAANWHVERHLQGPIRRNERDDIPLGFELDFAVDDVDTVFRRAVEAGADRSGSLRTNRGAGQRCSAIPTACSSTSAVPKRGGSAPKLPTRVGRSSTRHPRSAYPANAGGTAPDSCRFSP